MFQTFAIYAIIAILFATESFSVLASPSDVGIDSRIVDGILVETGEFPYVVSLQLNDRHICGGFIYNDHWVITAASCVQEYL